MIILGPHFKRWQCLDTRIYDRSAQWDSVMDYRNLTVERNSLIAPAIFNRSGKTNALNFDHMSEGN